MHPGTATPAQRIPRRPSSPLALGCHSNHTKIYQLFLCSSTAFSSLHHSSLLQKPHFPTIRFSPLPEKVRRRVPVSWFCRPSDRIAWLLRTSSPKASAFCPVRLPVACRGLPSPTPTSRLVTHRPPRPPPPGPLLRRWQTNCLFHSRTHTHHHRQPPSAISHHLSTITTDSSDNLASPKTPARRRCASCVCIYISNRSPSAALLFSSAAPRVIGRIHPRPHLILPLALPPTASSSLPQPCQTTTITTLRGPIPLSDPIPQPRRRRRITTSPLFTSPSQLALGCPAARAVALSLSPATAQR